MGEPPVGTVTFLFTDIEGSTRLARATGAVWQDVLAAHHDAVARAIERHGGYVDASQGDAFVAAVCRRPWGRRRRAGRPARARRRRMATRNRAAARTHGRAHRIRRAHRAWLRRSGGAPRRARGGGRPRWPDPGHRGDVRLAARRDRGRGPRRAPAQGLPPPAAALSRRARRVSRNRVRPAAHGRGAADEPARRTDGARGPRPRTRPPPGVAGGRGPVRDAGRRGRGG